MNALIYKGNRSADFGLDNHDSVKLISCVEDKDASDEFSSELTDKKFTKHLSQMLLLKLNIITMMTVVLVKMELIIGDLF